MSSPLECLNILGVQPTVNVSYYCCLYCVAEKFNKSQNLLTSVVIAVLCQAGQFCLHQKCVAELSRMLEKYIQSLTCILYNIFEEPEPDQLEVEMIDLETLDKDSIYYHLKDDLEKKKAEKKDSLGDNSQIKTMLAVLVSSCNFGLLCQQALDDVCHCCVCLPPGYLRIS